MKTGILTKREEEIIKLLIKGYNNTEIAAKLSISKFTTKAHVSSIISKLQVSNRVQVVVKYL